MIVLRHLCASLVALLLFLATPMLLAVGHPRSDFNGDGKSDLLWRNVTTGQAFMMPMNGSTPLPGGVFCWSEPSAGWQIVGTGDFDGDGKADILWWNKRTGDVFLMLMDGMTIKWSGIIYTEPNTAWTIQAIADFNGDGKADILWRNGATGQVYLLPMNGSTAQPGTVIWTEPNTAWQIVGTADFDGDGKADILWWNSTTGQVFQMLMNGMTVKSSGLIYTEPNTAWKVVSLGDFDGNGKADLLWRNSSTGAVYLMPMNGSIALPGSIIWTESNMTWQILAVGDFDGDGKDDIVWQNSSTGQIFQMLMNGTSVKSSGVIYTEPNTDWTLQVGGAQVLSLPPVITIQPANQSATAPQTAIFSVVATGPGPLSYQWTKNGVAIPGATSATYTTLATTAGDGGAAFAVIVSNTSGNVVSNTVFLTVSTPTSSAITINAAALTPTEWANTSFKGTIQSVTVPPASGRPVVNFTITDAYGTPVSGFGALTSRASTALYPSYSNLAFTIAKLVPGTNGSPNYWMNYIVTSTPTTTTAATAAKPSTENTGTLVDHGDGTYQYTFTRDITAAQAFLDAVSYSGNNVRTDLGDVTFVPTLTHRMAIQVGGNARGTSTNTPDGSNSGSVGVPPLNPTNIIYDFVPATGKAVTATDTQRQIVNIDSCNRCHTTLQSHASRVDTQYCVTCHTDQRKYGAAEAPVDANGNYTGDTSRINGMAVGNLVTLVHKLHMGGQLQKTGYSYGGIAFNNVTYPQHVANCQMCHTGTAVPENPNVQSQGDNWKTRPSRMACGDCHDSVNFATGVNHGSQGVGGVQLDDSNCVLCHTPAAIQINHTPVVQPDTTNAGLTLGQGGVASNTNASYVTGDLNNLPAGAHWFKWNIKSVSVNASRQPVWVFNFLQDGTTPVVFNAWTAAQTPAAEMMTGYVGSPNLYMAFSVPQDGITKPADWNSSVSVNLRKLWRGAAAAGSTLTGPDANGFYTATLAGVTVPATATMITGGIGYFYGVVAAGTTGDGATDGLQFTQINLSNYPFNVATVGGVSVVAPYQGGLSVSNPNQWLQASGQTNRRAIVTTAKCNECHQNLGVFTASVFHDGQRNDAPTCTFCHNVNGVDSGWGYNIKEVVHSLHASAFRTTPYTWQAGRTYWNVTYPAILNNCEACHVPGSYDFSASTNAAAVPNLLWTTMASGTMNAAGIVLTDPTTFDPAKSYLSPFVIPGVNYGQGLQVNTTTATKSATTWMGVTTPLAVGATLQPEPTTLVNSPISSACYDCHDSSLARAHMVGNGGSLHTPRSTVTTAVAGITTVPIVQNEQCLICHGNSRTADIKTIHMNFK
jgi:OmcA/MtrC family decaheme c-type cytochrome